MSQILPTAPARRLARAPGVRIQVQEGLDDSLKEALRQGDLDLVVVALAGLILRDGVAPSPAARAALVEIERACAEQNATGHASEARSPRLRPPVWPTDGRVA